MRLFRHPPSRGTYWSCSAFADFLRSRVGFTKPSAATSEGWQEWKQTNKLQHKFVFWLTEEFLDKVQDFVMFPADVWDAIRVYIRNRFIDKIHYLPTRLSPGDWYDLDTRILHGLFESLVDFVECESAWMHVVFDEEAKQKYNYPFWSVRRWLRFGSFRNPEAGIAHLEWEISLVFDESAGVSPEDEHFGKPTPQATAAKEQLELYRWWKNVRPARPDPFDATEHLEKPGRYDEWHKIEEQYNEEDEAMLIRLIKIRRTLWT